jgi:tetraacyldisaccharide 4'-kinase
MSGNAEPLDERLSGMLSGRVVLRTRIRPLFLMSPDGGQRPLSFLQGKRIFAFAGIAHPDSFRQTIESQGGVIAGFRTFEDHHRYRAEDLSGIEKEAQQSGADLVLATEKDLVKLSGLPPLPSRLCALVIETEILEGRERLDGLLQGIMEAKRQS